MRSTVRTLLFLCSGNYYRSRYAELSFNHLAPQRGLAWTSVSRGMRVNPANIGPISHYALSRLQERGIPVSEPIRLPLAVTEADLLAAGRVIAVKHAEHYAWMQKLFPTWADRIEYWHIHDLDCATPEVALTELDRHLESLLDSLAGG